MLACDFEHKPAREADCLIKKTNKEARGRGLRLGLRGRPVVCIPPGDTWVVKSCIQTGYSTLDSTKGETARGIQFA